MTVPGLKGPFISAWWDCLIQGRTCTAPPLGFRNHDSRVNKSQEHFWSNMTVWLLFSRHPVSCSCFFSLCKAPGGIINLPIQGRSQVLEPCFSKVKHEAKNIASIPTFLSWSWLAINTFSDLPCLTVDHKTLVYIQSWPTAGKRNAVQRDQEESVRQAFLAFPTCPITIGLSFNPAVPQ